jgi:hypothetical protein
MRPGSYRTSEEHLSGVCATTHLTWLALRQKPVAARVLPTHGACARAVGSCHWKVHWKRIFQPESGPQGQMRGQTWLGRSSMLIALEVCPVEEGGSADL